MNDSLKFLDNFRCSILNMLLFVFLNDKMFYLYDLWRFTNAYNIMYNARKMLMMKLINCGCGAKYCKSAEWENIDFNSHSKYVRQVNLLKGLPYEDNSVDMIFSSCLLEHFDSEQASFFLDEAYRCLKKGGIIRIVVPDLENVCREYLKQLDIVKYNDTKENESRYEYVLIELIDQMTRKETGGKMFDYWKSSRKDAVYIQERTGMPEREEENDRSFLFQIKNILYKVVSECLKNSHIFNLYTIGKFQTSGEVHQWMYDSYSLSKLLDKHGFRDVACMEYNVSNCINWKKYALEVNKDGTEYKPNSLYIEARR